MVIKFCLLIIFKETMDCHDQPCYYNNTRGRKPRDIEVMLRMYLMQDWFHLSDEGIEEASGQPVPYNARRQ